MRIKIKMGVRLSVGFARWQVGTLNVILTVYSYLKRFSTHDSIL